MKKTFSVQLLGLLISLILVSCETASYYGQAAAGQLYILNHRQDIKSLIENESTAPELKEKLETILTIRTFAEEELQLPLENSYSTYVDVQRPYVVWNVFASPEFSMQPRSWCYPIAGCVSYRAYFSEAKAHDFADQLREQDYDVYVGGVAAYSTLGWFSDSILNTIIDREDYQLASLIFHELAHLLLYIPGDTEFNESFATAVEQEGLRRWLLFTRDNSEQSKSAVEKILQAAELNSKRKSEFVTLVSQTTEALQQFYSSNEAVSEEQKEEMRESKQEIMAQLKAQYETLKYTWGNYSGYDAWFARDLNNAQLNTVATYFKWVPAFQMILAQEQNNLENFYNRVRRIEELDSSERREVLESVRN